MRHIVRIGEDYFVAYVDFGKIHRGMIMSCDEDGHVLNNDRKGYRRVTNEIKNQVCSKLNVELCSSWNKSKGWDEAY